MSDRVFRLLLVAFALGAGVLWRETFLHFNAVGATLGGFATVSLIALAVTGKPE